ncbi:MAG: NAD-dependent epimerase/dehydratase family protein [Myxococcales bacterium]|nr:NAD-dependent epimerase/dehydratase family protein [Myxococcales bacterium]MCB9715023.1 NAD-dependent epimerase/dehydratase family protein [Myxococcales bacterium]
MSRDRAGPVGLANDDGHESGHEPGTLRAGKRRIFIAGARRRVAVHLIERLIADPDVEVILAVDRGACPPTLLGCDPDRFVFSSADLSRRRQVDNLFLLDQFRGRRFDTVLHLAFQGNPHGYNFKSHEFNVNAAQHLLEASLRHGVDKYIFLSSDAVYRLGPRNDYKVREDAELNLDPSAHPILRDTLDAEFICRAKMDDPHCEVMVIRPSGVFGGGVISGINLLFESNPPVLPVGFDPMVNPTTKERLSRDLMLAISLHGKGVFNVAGSTIGPLSRFLEERGIKPIRVPGVALKAFNRVQRTLGMTRYHAGFHPKRLYYSLVLDDAKFERMFRANAHRVLGLGRGGDELED